MTTVLSIPKILAKLEKRLGVLIGRSSREAFETLQLLQDHPKLEELVAELEKVRGTIHKSDIAQALRRLLPRE